MPATRLSIIDNQAIIGLWRGIYGLLCSIGDDGIPLYTTHQVRILNKKLPDMSQWVENTVFCVRVQSIRGSTLVSENWGFHFLKCEESDESRKIEAKFALVGTEERRFIEKSEGKVWGLACCMLDLPLWSEDLKLWFDRYIPYFGILSGNTKFFLNCYRIKFQAQTLLEEAISCMRQSLWGYLHNKSQQSNSLIYLWLSQMGVKNDVLVCMLICFICEWKAKNKLWGQVITTR